MQVEDEKTLPPAEDELDNYSYYGKKEEGISFKQIVLRGIEKCRIEGSKEMTKGGQKMIYSRELSDWIPMNLPDQRKVWEQTIKQLHDLLLFYFDKTAKENIPRINEEIKNAYKIFYEQYLESENWIPYKEVSEQTKTITTGKQSSVGSHYIQLYEEYVFEKYREMYQELLLLFKREKELSNVSMLGYTDD